MFCRCFERYHLRTSRPTLVPPNEGGTMWHCVTARRCRIEENFVLTGIRKSRMVFWVLIGKFSPANSPWTNLHVVHTVATNASTMSVHSHYVCFSVENLSDIVCFSPTICGLSCWNGINSPSINEHWLAQRGWFAYWIWRHQRTPSFLPVLSAVTTVSALR